MNIAVTVNRIVKGAAAKLHFENPMSRMRLPVAQRSGGSDDVSLSPTVAEGRGDDVLTCVRQPTQCETGTVPCGCESMSLCSLCQTAPWHHCQMEYMTPAIRIALTMIVAMPAVSRMESCQSCFGSNAMLHSSAAAERRFDLDHG